MRLDAVKILEFPITRNSKTEILEYIRKYLDRESSTSSQRQEKTQKIVTIVTPNPEQLIYAQTDKHFAQILKQADVAIPDGIGIVWASRFLGSQPVVGRIPGVELMERLVEVAAKGGFPVGLIGGRGKLAVKALECLQKKYPGLVGWGQDGPEVEITNYALIIKNGPETQERYFANLARQINDEGTRVVFIGLGAPKQEYFMEELRFRVLGLGKNKTKNPTSMIQSPQSDTPLILMPVGGAFDMIAGHISRAPSSIRNIGLEWLWRLVRQPWRIHRQLALGRFILLVLREKLLHTEPI